MMNLHNAFYKRYSNLFLQAMCTVTSIACVASNVLHAVITAGSIDTTTLADISVHSACDDDDDGGDDDDDDDDDRCLFQRSSQTVADENWQFWVPTFFFFISYLHRLLP